MGRLRMLQELRGHTDRVWYVCWHPTGKVLATCSTDKTIRIWGPQYLAPATGAVNNSSTVVEPDDTGGKRPPEVIACTKASSVLPSNELQWVCKFTLTEGHTRTIRSLAWSPDGRSLVSCGFDGVVNIWQLSEGDFECTASLEGHENEVKSVAWSASGRYLATCGRDKTVWIWEAVGADDNTTGADELDFECESVMHSHTQDVKKVLWHPNDDVLISTSYDDTLKFYRKDGDDWSCYDTVYGHSSTVWSADMQPDGNVLVSSSADKTLRFWALDADAQPPAQLWKAIGLCENQHDGPIYDVRWNSCIPDLVATACGDNGVRVFRTTTLTKTNEQNQDVADEEVLEGGNLFDKLRSEFSVHLVADERNAHTRDCNAVAWYPSREVTMLASAGDDNVVKLWLYEPNERSDGTGTATETDDAELPDSLESMKL